MKIETKRLVLREFKPSDKENLMINLNNKKVARNLVVVPHPYTKKDADWWINHCKEKWAEEDLEGYEFTIELK